MDAPATVKQENGNGNAAQDAGNQERPAPKKFQQNQNRGGNQDRGGPKKFQNRGGGDRNQGNRQNQNRGGGGGPKNEFGFNQDSSINQKLRLLNGPTHDLPSVEPAEIKFSGRNRLYIGNLTSDVTEEELKELFKPYGEISEAFINKEKNFAFLKIDYHVNAERAKKELDGTIRKNRQIRIRFAPNATTLRVKNLTPFVSNELLYKAFEVFGQLERAVIIVDDRGKPTGEGIVEFARKSGAVCAQKYCNEKCFFLTSSLRPCVVEPFEHIDDTDGYPEKSLSKKNQDYFKARNSGPRFAEVGSFEHEFGTRWKQLHELFKQKQEALKRELQMEEEKLEAQMEFARYEHETELLREQLRMREQDRDRQKEEWEKRNRQMEEFRQRDEQQMRRQQEDMQMRMQRQEEELKRRQQENTLFMQAQQLSNMLDQQEMNQNYNGGGGGGGGRKNFDNDNRRTYDMMNQGGGNMGNHGHQNQQQYYYGYKPHKSRYRNG